MKVVPKGVITKTVKCIDASDTNAGFTTAKYLQEGKEYQAYQSGNPDQYVVLPEGHWWNKSRFVDVQPASATTATSPTTIAINDHICPTCSCNRVSKAEKTCWRCGNPL